MSIEVRRAKSRKLEDLTQHRRRMESEGINGLDCKTLSPNMFDRMIEWEYQL